MILHYTDKEISHTLLEGDSEMIYEALEQITAAYEKVGFYLVSEENNCYQFATKVGGWVCTLLVADDYVKNIC